MRRKTFGITAGILAAVIIALAGANIALDNRKDWDVCYGMANAKISWKQTYHGGAWNSD